jgi:hypothetical protein
MVGVWCVSCATRISSKTMNSHQYVTYILTYFEHIPCYKRMYDFSQQDTEANNSLCLESVFVDRIISQK